MQNLWAVMAVGLLAEGLARRAPRPGLAPWAGIGALALAALASPVPAVYLNWGRYTQLAGQIFLPAALLWSLEDWSWRQPPRSVLRVVLVVAALALTHYRVGLLYGGMLPLLLLALLWRERDAWRRAVPVLLRRATLCGLLVVILILPWYAELASGFLVERVVIFTASTTPAQQQAMQDHNQFGDIYAHVPRWQIVAGGVALLWLLARRRWESLLLGGGIASFFLLANPYTLLGLPGTGLINNFAVQIGLYQLLAPLVAWGAADAAWALSDRGPRARQMVPALLGLLLLAAALPNVWQQSRIANLRGYGIFLPSDARAAAWIAHNTPDDAIFHVNGFPAFGGGVIAGSDGGWWLWQSAHRATTVPPIVYDTERGPTPDYRESIRERYTRLQAAHDDPAALAAALRAEGIGYVYVGAQQGMAGLPPGIERVQPDRLLASDAFEPLYTDGAAWVFRVVER